MKINGRHEAFTNTVYDAQRSSSYDIWLSSKYCDVYLLEKGRFGMVCEAMNRETKQKVAIKSIELKKGPRLISVLREIQISKYLSLVGSKAITELLDIEIPANKIGSQWEFDTIHLVLEYFPADLKSTIKYDTKMNNDDHCKRKLSSTTDFPSYFNMLVNNGLLNYILTTVFVQMLFGLRDLHYANIIHRDIKPSNMLVSSKEEPENLKLCDFGNARAMKKSHANSWMVYNLDPNPWGDDEETDTEVIEEENKTTAKESSSTEVSSSSSSEEEFTTLEIKQRYEDGLTNELGTIGYRAPELTLNCAVYHKPADIWAVGCVFAELVTKKKLFRFEGESNEEQFNAIISKMGSSFITEDLKFIDNREGLQLARKKKKESLRAPKLSAHFKKLDGKGKDGKEEEILLLDKAGVKLLERFLKFDPNERITVQNALRSPYFSGIYEELKLKYGHPNQDIQIEKDKEKQQSEKQFKEKLWSEMQDFHGYKEGAEPKADEKHKRQRRQ